MSAQTSNTLFSSLSAQSRRSLIAAYNDMPVEEVDLSRTVMLNGKSPAWIFERDYMVMLRACRDGLIEVLRELLDKGLSPNLVGSPHVVVSPRGEHEVTGNRFVIPLAWTASAPNATDLAQLLLDRGADPNLLNGARFENGDVSPMHGACSNPDLLKLLVANGGDVNLVAPDGWSVLDHWLWTMHSPSKDRQAPGLSALDVMIESGLDTSQKLEDGGSFLTHCWASGFLRRHIPSFIQKGFDPHCRGSATGVKGNSLVEHLEKKVKAGKGGALAGEIIASIQAEQLATTTLPASGASKGPRL